MGNWNAFQRRSITGLFLAIATVQCGAVGLATTATASSLISDKALIAFRMESATDGWALTQDQVLFTKDGGTTWSSRTPKSLGGVHLRFGGSPMGPANGFDPIDPRSVLLAVSQVGQVSIFRTSNYGTTWRKSTVRVRSAKMDFSKVRPLILDLVSAGAKDSWLLVSNSGSGAGFEDAEMYKSDDGFATWKMISSTMLASGLPGGGIKTGLTFSNSLQGWLTGYRISENSAWLYTTSDGGSKWHSVSLVRPAGYSSTGQYPLTFAPTFFNEVGFLPVLWPKEHSEVFYVSHDGGTRWVPSEPVSTPGGSPLRTFSWVNANIGFAVTTSTICETLTGGTSWYCSRQPIAIRDMNQIQFLSRDHGWALVHGVVFETFKGTSNWFRIY